MVPDVHRPVPKWLVCHAWFMSLHPNGYFVMRARCGINGTNTLVTPTQGGRDPHLRARCSPTHLIVETLENVAHP